METNPTTTQDPLEPLRKEIDEADRELIQVLARRFDAVRKVGSVKRLEENQALLDSDRELRIQDRWTREAVFPAFVYSLRHSPSISVSRAISFWRRPTSRSVWAKSL